MIKTYEEYLEIIGQEPLPEMVSEHYGEDGLVEYYFIRKSILQRELARIYLGNVRWNMTRDNLTNNGIYGVGLLEVKHPVSGEWLHFSGVASLPHEKVMRLNYPRLEAYCMMNACKKIGPWFGQTLNSEKEDEEEVVQLHTTTISEDKLEILIDSAGSLEELAQYKKELPSHLKVKYMSKLKTFIRS